MFALCYVSGSKLVENTMDKSWIDCSKTSPEYEKAGCQICELCH